MKVHKRIGVFFGIAMMITGCGSLSKEPMDELQQEPTVKVGKEILYQVKSEDGLVCIDQYEHYYEVTLDLEAGSHAQVAKDYMEAIAEIEPDYESMMESYLYEMMNDITPEFHEYSILEEYADKLLNNMNSDYLEEINAVAEFSQVEEEGFVQDKKLSKYEMICLMLMSDLLRPTQCSGCAVYGGKSSTGGMLTAKVSECDLGREYQMLRTQAIVHFKNDSKSFTAITHLGVLNATNILTDDGVFIGGLDSSIYQPFCMDDDKISFTYDLRYAAENFSSTSETSKYIVGNGKKYTYSNNVLVTDASTACVVENCTSKDTGLCAIRTAESKLMDGLLWENEDSLCVVNGFALEGNFDNITPNVYDSEKWGKFNIGLQSFDSVTVQNLKDMVIHGDNSEILNPRLSTESTTSILMIDVVNQTFEVSFGTVSDTLPMLTEYIQIPWN